MKFRALLTFAIVNASLCVYSVARCEETRRTQQGQQHSQPQSQPRQTRATVPQRQQPAQFQPHPAGTHPHGAIVRPHATRVVSPRTVPYGSHQWKHWNHPEFSRPAYYWDWNNVHNVTCTAEDSYGDQYPVTEATTPGFGLNNMTQVEDDALDRCASESGGDQTCYLVTCSHF